MRIRVIRHLACAGLVLAATPLLVQGQGPISVWGGIGASLGEDDDGPSLSKDTKQLGLQFTLPALPIGLRADALVFGDEYDSDHLSWNVNAVFRMPFPVVQPYGIIGTGEYAIAPGVKERGWNAGAGLRFGVSRFGIFAEVRRHDPLDRNVMVAGITF
jgi:hypothetical protein